MRIKWVETSQFKGLPDGKYPLYQKTFIKGQNGSCKSTLATAILWVFSDCDYAFHSNPMVAPLHLEESNPTVTLLCDVEGQEVSITKSQTNKTVNDGDTTKRSSSNKYLVNDVPITLRDFKTKMASYGIDLDKILPLMHPMAFTSQKAAEMKKVLFEMASDKTDLDIAKMDESMKHLVSDEDGYANLAVNTTEEISAKFKAVKKKANEMIEAIPNQIIGLERGKTAEDPAPLKKRQKEIQTEIESLRKESAKADKSGEIEEIRTQLFEAKRNTANFGNDMAAKENAFRKELVDATLVFKKAVSENRSTLNSWLSKKQTIESKMADAKWKKDKATNEYRTIKSEKPPVFNPPRELTEEDMICPCCGQALPEKLKKEKIADYKERYAEAKESFDRGLEAWNVLHEKNLKKVTEEGQQACDDIRTLESMLSDCEKEISDTETKLKEAEERLFKAEADEAIPYKPAKASLQQYDKLKERESYLEQLLQSAVEIGNGKKSEIDEQIHTLENELHEIGEALAKISNNYDIDDKIANLQAERMVYEQKKADAEMVLYELDLLSKKKNDLLVEEINSHFSLVKFQLFEYQKNGGYKEVCVPTIDGYRFGESTNTGREIRGKLDICQSLQKFYGMNIPIILDNAESINSYNIPDIDSQLIMLTVTDDKHLVIEGDD